MSASPPTVAPDAAALRGTPATLPSALVLYDGVCGLCDRSVQWLLSVDREEALFFAPLQGETAAAVLARHPELPPGTDSILFVERSPSGEERLTWRSTAVLRVCAHLPRPWRALGALSWVPTVLTDLAYRVVAALRYRLFGKLEMCRVPTPRERRRFLP